jgi:hypothetical protein
MFLKIRPRAAELFHAGGWTDVTKPTVAFRKVANAPKNLHDHTNEITIPNLGVFAANRSVHLNTVAT